MADVEAILTSAHRRMAKVVGHVSIMLARRRLDRALLAWCMIELRIALDELKRLR